MSHYSVITYYFYVCLATILCNLTYSSGYIPVSLDLDFPDMTHLYKRLSKDSYSNWKYLMRPLYLDTHKIGDVWDRQILICSDLPNLVYRDVIELEECGRIIMIKSKILTNDGNFVHEVLEYRKVWGSDHYEKLNRKPIDLDLSEFPHLNPPITTYGSSIYRMMFYIPEELLYRFVIGEVKYGTFVLNNEIIGIRSKSVEYRIEGREVAITIRSINTSGMNRKIEYKCKFEGGNMEEIIAMVKKDFIGDDKEDEKETESSSKLVDDTLKEKSGYEGEDYGDEFMNKMYMKYMIPGIVTGDISCRLLNDITRELY